MMNVRKTNKIEITDMVSDGFEDGIVVSIRVDGGDTWYDVYDGKEAWTWHRREIKEVNGFELA